MRVGATALPGVLVVEPPTFRDGRGSFQETWSRRRAAAAGLPEDFVQDNLSRSAPGVLRGLHFQHPNAQGKLVAAVAGAILDVAVDLRRGSPHFGRWVAVTLSAAGGRQLYVPPGFAHGFLALGAAEAVVVYKCTAAYSPSDERVIRWDDPTLGIAWPLAGPPGLSPRDRDAPTLADIPPEHLPPYGG